MLPCNYDRETDTAGLYRGRFHVCLHDTYDQSKSTLKLEVLPRVLQEHMAAQGAFLVNNHSIMLVGDGYYGLCHGDKYGQDDEEWSFPNMEGCGFTWHPIHHVGYIKTKPVRWDIPCLPWHLFVDEHNRTSFDYKSVVELQGVVHEAPAPSLYKELIQSGADFVYMTVNGPKFMMIGDV